MVNMIKSLEDEIVNLFPRKWKEDDIKRFIKDIKYSIDVKALNNNLNYPARDFILRKGKRLRPVLFLRALQLLDKNYKKYTDIAILIEIVHNATLILDDIEDNGILRRGDSTCHIKFGVDTAVNTGMGLHVLPLTILNNKKIPDHKKLRLYEIYSHEVINLSFGQAIDIQWHKYIPEDINKDKYLEMVRLKTGSLMRMGMRMAAIIGSDDPKLERKFSEFGEELGIAFQIIDDALDLKNNGDKFGKAFGNDISEGKISLPIVLALKKLNKKERRQLLEILKLHTRDRRKIKQALKIINKTGSIDESMEFARQLLLNSWKKFERGFTEEQDLSEMKALALFFVERTY